jgi:hypothetical protein
MGAIPSQRRALHCGRACGEAAKNGKGIIVRLQEMSGRAIKATLTIGGETPLKPVALKPWEIKTLRHRLTRKGWSVTGTDFLEIQTKGETMRISTRKKSIFS